MMPDGPASLVVAAADLPPVSLPGPAAIACAKECVPNTTSGTSKRLDKRLARAAMRE
jgi:hypothetical protein